MNKIVQQIAQLLVQSKQVQDPQQAIQIAGTFVQAVGGEDKAGQLLSQAAQQGQNPVEVIAQVLQQAQRQQAPQAYRQGGIFKCPEGYTLSFKNGGTCPICKKQEGDQIIKKKEAPKYFSCGGRAKKHKK